MKIETFAPVGMILLSILASSVYFLKGDVRHGLYWASSAVLISSVTF